MIKLLIRCYYDSIYVLYFNTIRYQGELNLKKLKNLLISIALIVLLAVSASADESLPESSHSYADNCYESYFYSIPDARGLLVTFSEDTWVEPAEDLQSVGFTPDENGQITVKDVLDAAELTKRGDHIYLYNADGSFVGAYQGDELAGKTVFVAGSKMKIILSSDSSVTGYGFRVTSVVPCDDELLSEVTYYTGLESPASYSKLYYLGGEASVDEQVSPNGYRKNKDGCAFIGWSGTPDGAVKFDGGEQLPVGIGDFSLYALWSAPLLGTDEIFLFNNSSYYFTDGEDGCYYLTDEAMQMLQRNIFSVFGPSPVPATILGTVLYTYPSWSWQGSCYGMSTVTFLQHHGVIDMLPMQNASTMNDMVLNDELKSFINYYQAQAATSWLCENKAAIPGTADYASCLMDLYRTVENGNIAMLTFYEGAAFVTMGHTVLVTDVYTNAKGEHILIVYDNNHPWRYTDGMTDRFVIAPDWKSAVDDYGDETGAINWTDTTSQFESFDIDGDGSPLTWHLTWLHHMTDTMHRFLRTLSLLIERISFI